MRNVFKESYNHELVSHVHATTDALKMLEQIFLLNLLLRFRRTGVQHLLFSVRSFVLKNVVKESSSFGIVFNFHGDIWVEMLFCNIFKMHTLNVQLPFTWLIQSNEQRNDP